ncbi:unnamed protein product, partial [Prorocentrum cordatum]
GGRPEFLWRSRSWLLQGSVECELGMDACTFEVYQMLALLATLSVCIAVVICLFSFFREDRDDQITPLCPQMVVNGSELSFTLPLTGEPESLEVLDADGRPMNRILIDVPGKSAGGGMMAQARLQDVYGKTLATVVARDTGLSLFRGCEIFGFVEPEEDGSFNVRHRTGVHLLTLSGSVDVWDVEGINPVGSRVCSFKEAGEECRGSVIQGVDSGLVIVSLCAVHLHQRMQRAGAFQAPYFKGDAFPDS